jgi:hypothetical protein
LKTPGKVAAVDGRWLLGGLKSLIIRPLLVQYTRQIIIHGQLFFRENPLRVQPQTIGTITGDII